MTFKTVFFALTLTLLPNLALAMGCSKEQHTATSCEAGQVWDDATSSCVESVSS